MPLARRIALVAAVAVISLINRGLIAQSPPRPDFKAATASVLVDVVVRDPHGAAINDLTARDFNVLEEGVPQTLDAFHVVRPGDGAPAPAVVALAFDPLSSEGLALAVKSVDAYLGTVRRWTSLVFSGWAKAWKSFSRTQPMWRQSGRRCAACRRRPGAGQRLERRRTRQGSKGQAA
jgi:hypothetical protein